MEKIHDEGFEPTDLNTSETQASAKAMATSGEDLLIAEIDAFRDKATKLQRLISEKENKAAELEALVLEKEATNIRLQEELNRKQQEADSLVSDVETQVDRMMQTVKSNMDQLGIDIKDQVEGNQEAYETQHKSLQESLSQVSDYLDSVSSELSEKTHSESVHLYRLIQDLLKEYDKSEEQANTAIAHYKSLKSISIVLIVLLVLTLGVSVVSLLISLGIIVL